MAEIPELQTDRLLLRDWRGDDLEPMTAINQDVRVAEWLGGVNNRDQTEARMKVWIDQWNERGYGQWAVEERASQQLVGRVGFTTHADWTASPHDAEIGWALAFDSWNRGYATEAASAVLEWARQNADLKSLISVTLPDNVRSRRVMEKLGLTYAGQTTWRGREHVWYGIELQREPGAANATVGTPASVGPEN